MKILNLTDKKVVIDVSIKCGYPLEFEILPNKTREIYAGEVAAKAIKEVVNTNDEVMFLD